MGTASDKPRNNLNESSPFSQVPEDKKETTLYPDCSVSSYLSESWGVQSGIQNETGSKEMLRKLDESHVKPSGSGDSETITLNGTQVDEFYASISAIECTLKNDSNANLDINSDDAENDIRSGQMGAQVGRQIETDPEFQYEVALSKIISAISLEKENTERPENTFSRVLEGGDEIPTTSRRDCNGSGLEKHHVSSSQSEDSTEDDTSKTDLQAPEFSRGTLSSRYSFADPSSLLNILKEDPTPRASSSHDHGPLNTVFESVVDEMSADKPSGGESIYSMDLASTESETTLDVNDDSYRTAGEDIPVPANPLTNGEPEQLSKDILPNESRESLNSDETKQSKVSSTGDGPDQLSPSAGSSKSTLLSPSAGSSKSTLPETCVHASEFNLSPTKRSPNLETTPENHYYNNNQFLDPNRFEEIYSTREPIIREREDHFYEDYQLGSFWNGTFNYESTSDNQKGNEMSMLKQRLVDLQISVNKTRKGVDFKLKTIISDLRIDFDYWGTLLGGALDTIQAMSIVEEQRELASPVFSDVSNEDQWTAAADGGEKGASSGVPQPTKLQDPNPQNSEHSNDGPMYGLPIPTAPYNYGLNGPAGYNRMTMPNRMYYPAYHGYAPRAKYQPPHQAAFMFGHNMRPPGHHQFPSPSHGGMHYPGRSMPPPKSISMPKVSHPGGFPFLPNHSNAETSTQTGAAPTAPSHYSSGGGTPFPPNRSNTRPPQQTSSSQSAPPSSSNNSYCGGPPFPKRSHAMPPPGRNQGNAPVQKVPSVSPKETEEDATSAKTKFAAKEKPKKKNNNRKRVTSKPHQGKILP